MTDVLHGYALMRMPQDVLSLYEVSPIARGNPQLLGQLRAALSTVDIAAYRGISRDPLDAFPDRSPTELRRLELALFPTRADAETLRSWYRTKHWAETEMEPGQFCVIAVGPG